MRRPRARESKDDDPLYSSNQRRHCVTDVVVESLRLCCWAWSQLLSYSVNANPSGGGDTVQGLYEALLNTMKNGQILGRSGRFTQLEPVIRRSFDIALMARPI
jgi:hypothetical protein